MDDSISPQAHEMKTRIEQFMIRINPELFDYTERAEFPHHLIGEIAKLGVVGADYPTHMGGKGFSISDMGSLMYEFARRDASIATFFLLHHSLGNYTVFKLAQPSLRDKILKDTLSL